MKSVVNLLLAEKGQVVAALDINLGADDRLYATGYCLLIEPDSAGQPVVVSQGQGWHV